MSDFSRFLLWEHASRDTIDFKKIYVDMAGDLNAGLMLSEIVYWYLPSGDGSENKLRVERDGYRWIAVRRYEWWERTRFSPDQADRALRILVDDGLVTKKVYKFAGEVTLHIRLNEIQFIESWENLLKNPIKNPYATEMEIGKSAKSKSVKVQNPNAGKPEILLQRIPAPTTAEILKDSAPVGAATFNPSIEANGSQKPATTETPKAYKYPKRFKDYTAADVQHYYGEHAAALDALKEAWMPNNTMQPSVKNMARKDAQRFIETHSDLAAIAFPADEYAALANFARELNAWKKMQTVLDMAECVGQYTERRNARLGIQDTTQIDTSQYVNMKPFIPNFGGKK